VPVVGEHAPELKFTQLIGAPDGTKTGWHDLRGKVVVLEFWATWCAPCIAEIPHLNSLIQSMGPTNVQFIAVDDEDPALVKEFLAKKSIAGWVGVDTTKKVFDGFGVTSRPTTIVIDAHGHIAARMRPDQLDKGQLQALASGQPVVFPKDESGPQIAAARKAAEAAIAAASGPANSSAPKPLFEISIRPGDPQGKVSIMVTGGDGKSASSYTYVNLPLAALLQMALGAPASRITVHGGPTDAKYTMRLTYPGSDPKLVAPAIETAIATAGGMKLSHVATEEDAWVLQSTPQAGSLLSPTASKHESMCDYNARSGKMTMVGTSLDDLAPQLEEALGAPVVNEAALPGEFDASFDLPKGDAPGAKAALEKSLGLTLVKARRSIDRIVLDPLPPATDAGEMPKLALTPGSSMQTVAVPRKAPQ
jgi:thiol-disulfide isomerase/thioredoxin